MVTGKIKAIVRSGVSSKDNLYFDYDAAGNRIAKHVYTAGNVWKHSTYYLRDAQGNVMSVYHKETDPSTSTMSYKLDEQHLYGSSHIGMAHPDFEMIGASSPPDTVKYYLGNKRYELSNHLGNVLSVVSDKKIAVQDAAASGLIDHYVADQLSSTDYYAFGQEMPGRRYSGPNYRYGFNGKENDNEVKGEGNSVDYSARVYDPRLGRCLSIAPMFRKYPDWSSYKGFEDNPIIYQDPDGGDEFLSIIVVNQQTLSIWHQYCMSY